MEGSMNRKQRRDAALASSNEESTDDAKPSVPLVHHSEDARMRNGPSGKTLYDIIQERQEGLLSKQHEKTGNAATPTGKSFESSNSGGSAGTQFVTVDPSTGKILDVDDPSASYKIDEKDGKAVKIKKKADDGGKNDDNGDNEEELIPPVFDTLLLSVTMTTLHLTLAYLVAHQYAQEIPVKALFRESLLVAFPILTLLIHLAHGHIISFGGSSRDDRGPAKMRKRKNKDQKKKKEKAISLLPLTQDKLTFSFLRKLIFPPALRTCAFLPLAAFLGFRLMVLSNEEPYYAVMKQSPSMGTLWVWCILELSLGPAVLGALGPLGWGMYWKGYGIF